MVPFRIGNGFDSHRLVDGRKLILGGVEINSELGLLGHSDGDALTHSIIDALLGAAALGDIGMRYPPGDHRYRNADSLAMLREVAAEIRASKHLTVVNVDAVIICQRPKLSSHFDEMRNNLAGAMSVDVSLVNIKATTNEGMGHLGRGEGIAVWAVALLRTEAEIS